MRVLHLCSYYIGSQVHRNLVMALANLETCSQHVWVPIRVENHRGVNDIDEPNVRVVYSKCLGILTRCFFSWKLLVLFFSVRNAAKGIGLEKADVIHAHTLYSDGFLAFILFKLYSIPYVVSVRSTDVNIFERILPHWKWLTRMVLANAKCVLFLSPAHQKKIGKSYGLAKKRSLLLGSAVDPYWVENLKLQRQILKPRKLNAIYVGDINRNKNIKRAIIGFFSLDYSGDRTFTVIGGNYIDYQSVFGDLPAALKSKVIFVPRVLEKGVLCEYFATAAVLVMPSHFETFGLVYMEAISQCVPVIYSQGQGIDGLYPEGCVGFSCDPMSTSSVACAISKTLQAFPQGLIFSDKENPATEFCWDNRAKFLLKSAYS